MGRLALAGDEFALGEMRSRGASRRQRISCSGTVERMGTARSRCSMASLMLAGLLFDGLDVLAHNLIGFLP